MPDFSDDDNQQAKKALRRRMRDALAAITPRVRAQRSASAREELLAWNQWTNRRVVLAYLAMPDELDLDALWTAASPLEGRVLCAPKTDWLRAAMQPAAVARLDRDLITAHKGLREPAPFCRLVGLAELELVLAPGLAFDRGGARLGRGGGFYDRFLAELPKAALVLGVCFDEQIVDAVPTEPHDRPVDGLLTPSGVRLTESAE